MMPEKLLWITEDTWLDLSMGLDTWIQISEVRAAMTEVDNDEGCYVFDRLDKYWREHGGTSREMDYAEAFAGYLLTHMGAA